MANPLIVNPYANRKRTQKELNAIPDLRPDLSEAGKGIRAFADETQATGYGVLALGAQQLKDATGGKDGGFLDRTVDTGFEGYSRNIKEATAGRQAPNIARVEDIEDVYDATDIFIYPSRYEGYGMAAVEPMFRGVPVLVQDYPAIREAVGDAAIIMPYEVDSSPIRTCCAFHHENPRGHRIHPRCDIFFPKVVVRVDGNPGERLTHHLASDFLIKIASVQQHLHFGGAC